jgi:hypothetical protein
VPFPFFFFFFALFSPLPGFVYQLRYQPANMSPTAAEYGSAAWADGVEHEKEDPPAAGTPAKADGNLFSAAGSSEGWSVVQKGLLFGVILTAVAVWVKVTRRKNKKEDVGYEKVLS